jgi:hypothetical protein
MTKDKWIDESPKINYIKKKSILMIENKSFLDSKPQVIK